MNAASYPGTSAYVANGLVLRDQYLFSFYQQNPQNSSYSSYGLLAPQTLDYVSGNDGATNTLMLGENTQVAPTAAASRPTPLAKVHDWYDVGNDIANPSTSVPSMSPPTPVTYQMRQTFGFAVTASAYSSAIIAFAAPYGSETSSYYNGNPMTANINSSHSGGANVVFFDGHGQFLRDDVGLNMATGGSVTVYQILVTPEGSKNLSEPPADESQW